MLWKENILLKITFEYKAKLALLLKCGVQNTRMIKVKESMIKMKENMENIQSCNKRENIRNESKHQRT